MDITGTWVGRRSQPEEEQGETYQRQREQQVQRSYSISNWDSGLKGSCRGRQGLEPQASQSLVQSLDLIQLKRESDAVWLPLVNAHSDCHVDKGLEWAVWNVHKWQIGWEGTVALWEKVTVLQTTTVAPGTLFKEGFLFKITYLSLVIPGKIWTPRLGNWAHLPPEKRNLTLPHNIKFQTPTKMKWSLKNRLEMLYFPNKHIKKSSKVNFSC